MSLDLSCSLCSQPLLEKFAENINFQTYADDQQNYLSFKPSNTNSIAQCKQSLEACIKDIHKWMRTNKLKLNDEKTEVVLFGTRQQLEKKIGPYGPELIWHFGI